MYQKENNTANLQQIIENLRMMEEFNTQIIIKILEFVRRKNKSYSILKRHHLWKFCLIFNYSITSFGFIWKLKEIFQTDFIRWNIYQLRWLKNFLLWTIFKLYRGINKRNFSELQYWKQKINPFFWIWQNTRLLIENEREKKELSLINLFISEEKEDSEGPSRNNFLCMAFKHTW